jgi:6-phosphogluconolactonase
MERQRNYIYPEKEEMAAAFSCEVNRVLAKLSGKGREINIAFSGGSTPEAVFRELERSHTREHWKDVHLYWGDERCVPPGESESNFGNAWRSLLESLQLAPEQIHRIRGEEDPVAEAQLYGEHLLACLPVEKGWPVFDWIWLGVGADGHTASIFPGRMDQWKAESPCVLAEHPLTGQQRVSISGGVINAARRVSFLATGAEKAAIIREIIMKQGAYLEYPASHVSPESENLEWYLDKEASNLL